MNIIATPNAPAAIGPYVQGKIVNGLLYASGQIPLNPLDGEIVGDTIELQTEQVMKNIAAILKEAHSDFDSVIKTTCFLKNPVILKTKGDAPKQYGDQDDDGWDD